MAKKITNITYTLAGLFFAAFLDGFFNLGFSDNFYAILGLGMLVAVIWLLIIVRGEEFKNDVQ